MQRAVERGCVLLPFLIALLVHTSFVDADAEPPPTVPDTPAVIVSPSAVPAAALRRKRGTSNDADKVLVNITFTSADPSSSTYVDFASLTFPLDIEVKLRPLKHRDTIHPFGFSSMESEICPPRVRDRRSCVVALGRNVAAVELTQAELFDIVKVERIEVSFGISVFQGRRIQPFVTHFDIVPSDAPTVPLAFGLSLPLLIIDVFTAIAMPTTQDLGTLLLMPLMTCATSEQRGWVVGVRETYLPLPSDDIFTQAAAVVACMCVLALLFFALHAVGTHRGKAAHVQLMRELAPLTLAQLWLYFAARGLSFAAGRLMGSRYPRHQVFGASIGLLLLFSFGGIRSLIVCNPHWEWCRAQAPKHLNGGPLDKLRLFQRLTGHWFYDYGQPATVATRWAPRLFPREFDAGVRMRIVVPVLWIMSSLVVTVLGGSPRAPQGCFAHYVGLGLAQLLSAVFIIRVRAFRSYFLVACTVAIRAATALALLVLSAAADVGDPAEKLYFGCVGFALVVAVLRLCWWAYSAVAEVPPQVKRHHDQANLGLEEHDSPRADGIALEVLRVPGGPCTQEAEGAACRPKERDRRCPVSIDTEANAVAAEAALSANACGSPTSPLCNQSPDSPSCKNRRFAPLLRRDTSISVAVSDPSHQLASGEATDVRPRQRQFDEQSMISAYSAMPSNSSMGGFASREPQWLRDASRAKVRAQPEDLFAAQRPLWFPEERPHVRKDNVPDMPLRFSPYSVRNVQKKRRGGGGAEDE